MCPLPLNCLLLIDKHLQTNKGDDTQLYHSIQLEVPGYITSVEGMHQSPIHYRGQETASHILVNTPRATSPSSRVLYYQHAWPSTIHTFLIGRMLQKTYSFI